MFGSFWPLIGLFIDRQRERGDRPALEPILGFALLTASFVPSPNQHNPAHIDLPASFSTSPSAERQAATDRALNQLGRAAGLGRVVVDQSVLALTPEFYRSDEALSLTTARDFDSAIYFAYGLQSPLARETAAKSGLDRVYVVRGTEIRVATNRPADRLNGLPLVPAAD